MTLYKVPKKNVPLNEKSTMNEKTFPSVNISREFRASPEIIFDAWIKPEIMKNWLFKSPVNKIVRVTANPQANGVFSIVELTENGDIIDHFGQYICVDRPTKLEFTLEVPKHFPGVTEVSLTLGRTPEGSCRFHFVQTGVDPQMVEESWRKMLSQLYELTDC